MEAAKIYKKDTLRPLSDYQNKINEAAEHLCTEPSYVKKQSTSIGFCS